jgi:hypothetical protein
MKDILEQLAEMEVAPPPPEFDRRLHQRVNQSLMVQHVVDFAVGAVPWALWHFFRAVLGLVTFSVTGKFGEERKKRGEPDQSD